MLSQGDSIREAKRATTAAAVRDLIYISAAWDLLRLLTAVPVSSNPRAAVIVLTVKALLVEVVPFLLLRRGRVEQAAWALSLNAATAAVLVTISGGIRSSAVGIEVALLAVVVLLYERRSAILIAAAILSFLSLIAGITAWGVQLPVVLSGSLWMDFTNILSAATLILVPGLRAMERLTAERAKVLRTQQALSESETLFRGLSENSPTGVFRADADGNCIYANARLLEVWGMHWAEFRTSGVSSSIHPEDCDAVRAEMGAARAAKRAYSCEYRVIRPDGVRWVTARAVPVITTTGDYDGQVGTVIDTTEAVTLNNLLREKEAYMRTILDSEPECVKTLSPDGSLLEMNPAGLAMIEADDEAQVVGARVADLVDPDHRREFIEMHSRVMGGESAMMEFRITGLKGTVRWLETHAAPLRNGAGEITAAVVVSRDISDRKAREETQRRLELIQDAAHIGMWEREIDGSRMWVNAENLRMFGFPESSAPRPEDFWKRIYFEERAAVRQAFDRCLSEGGGFEAEFRVVWPDSSVHWVLSKMETIRGASGSPARIVGLSQDITARKNREQELRESEENFRTLFERAPYGVVLIDMEDYSIAGFNTLAHEQLGYTREEFAALKLWDFEVGTSREQILKMEQEGSDPPDEFETQHRAKDGQLRDVLVTTAPVHMGGRTLGYAAVQDITERKRGERELMASTARQRILAELSGAFWEQHDPDAVLSSSVRKLEEEFADLCAVRLLSACGKRLERCSIAFGVSMGFDAVREVLEAPLPMDEAYFHQEVVRTGRSQFIPVFDAEVSGSRLPPAHRAMARAMGAHSLLAVPLRTGDRVFGVLTVTRHRRDQPSFNDQDAAFIQALADRAALAYAAAKLRVDLQAELAQRKAMEAERDLVLAELQQLTKHLENAREDERSRIAREIHDELGQQLTGLKMRFDFLFRAPLTPEQLEEQKQSMHRELEASIRTVRTIATELRPGVLDSLGPAAALEWLARDFQEKFGIPCETHIQAFRAEEPAGTTLFRVAQEALTNVARHASARNVWLRCYAHADSVWLEVVDDGVGIREVDLRKSERFGLIGMRERAALAGGSLTVTRSEAGGTRLMLRLPALDGEIHHAILNRG